MAVKPETRSGGDNTAAGAAASFGNVVPLRRWGESTAKAGCNFIQCSQDVVAVGRAASDAMAAGLLDYWKDLRSLNGIWAEAVRLGLAETGRALGGGATAARVGGDLPSPTDVVKALVEANCRLLQRQTEAVTSAGSALSALPSRFLNTLDE